MTSTKVSPLNLDDESEKDSYELEVRNNAGDLVQASSRTQSPSSRKRTGRLSPRKLIRTKKKRGMRFLPDENVIEMWYRAPRGSEISDCPFTHSCLLALAAKRVAYTRCHVTTSTQIPEWVETFPTLNYFGKVLKQDGQFGDNTILEFIDKIHSNLPHPALINEAATMAVKELSHVFRSAAAVLVNTQTHRHEGLVKCLDKELGKADTLLMKSGGPWICGETMSLADCIFLPKLKHIQVAGRYFKNYSVPAEYAFLQDYMRAMFERPIFVSTCCEDKYIVTGWEHDGAHQSESAACALRQSSGLAVDEMYALDLTGLMSRHLDIRDRRWHGTLYENCFVASAAVDWFEHCKFAADRKDAKALGKRLLELGLIEHVISSRAVGFQDEYLFFRIKEPEGSANKNLRVQVLQRPADSLPPKHVQAYLTSAHEVKSQMLEILGIHHEDQLQQLLDDMNSREHMVSMRGVAAVMKALEPGHCYGNNPQSDRIVDTILQSKYLKRITVLNGSVRLKAPLDVPVSIRKKIVMESMRMSGEFIVYPGQNGNAAFRFNKWTLLMAAVNGGHVSLVETLLGAGATTDLTRKRKTQSLLSPWYLAIFGRNLDVSQSKQIAKLLLQNELDEAQSRGWSSKLLAKWNAILHMASFSGNVGLLEELLDTMIPITKISRECSLVHHIHLVGGCSWRDEFPDLAWPDGTRIDRTPMQVLNDRAEIGIFDNVVVRTVVKYQWEAYGRAAFWGTLARHACFTFILSALSQYYSWSEQQFTQCYWQESGDTPTPCQFIVEINVLWYISVALAVYNTGFAGLAILSSLSKLQAELRFFPSRYPPYWCMLLSVAARLLDFVDGLDTKSSYAFLIGAAVVLSWAKMLFFLRIEPNIGPLVLVLQNNVGQFLAFSSMLVSIIPGFYFTLQIATAFDSLRSNSGTSSTENSTTAGNSTVIDSNANCYTSKVGSAPLNLNYFLAWAFGADFFAGLSSSSGFFVRLLMGLYIIVVPTICFHLLGAMFTSSYNRVREYSQHYSRLVRSQFMYGLSQNTQADSLRHSFVPWTTDELAAFESYASASWKRHYNVRRRRFLPRRGAPTWMAALCSGSHRRTNGDELFLKLLDKLKYHSEERIIATLKYHDFAEKWCPFSYECAECADNC